MNKHYSTTCDNEGSNPGFCRGGRELNLVQKHREKAGKGPISQEDDIWIKWDKRASILGANEIN